MRILVATESKIKLDAVKKVCRTNGENHTVDGMKSSSGVSEQPVSKEIITGAENRMACIKKNENYDVYIAIENGIVPFLFYQNSEKWVDTAYVLIEKKDKNGLFKKSFAFSASIPIPQDLIDYVEKHNHTKTIGDALKELSDKPNIDSKDPHITLCGIHRADLLKEALEIALNSLD